jgi:hypothetical protein
MMENQYLAYPTHLVTFPLVPLLPATHLTSVLLEETHTLLADW